MGSFLRYKGSQCTLQTSTASLLDKLNKSKWNGVAHAKPTWWEICFSVVNSQGNSEATEVNDSEVHLTGLTIQ